MIDAIYIAASAHDARFTRTCVASIRRFHPDAAVRLLAGGPLQRGLARELRRHFDVRIADLPGGDYGWGFVKLEPLFGRPGERFLVLDSDTVLTGPVLRSWREDAAPFLVDDERQSDADTRRLYYDWDAVRTIDPTAQRPSFVFNSGQWFGTAGLLAREDFSPWLRWTMPRRLIYPRLFMPGDQGVFNYVLNQRNALHGLAVDRLVIMRWPGKSLVGITPETISSGEAPALVIHWAGLKRARQRDMKGSQLLDHFEREYYRRIPGGGAMRVARGIGFVAAAVSEGLRTRARLARRRWIGAPLEHP